MNNETLNILSDVQENKSYVVSQAIEVTTSFDFPENVTLIFTPQGGFFSNRQVTLRGNNTTIVADRFPIFGKNLKVRAINRDKGWISEYAYPEWFEKADTFEDHDDSIEINKAASINKYETNLNVGNYNISKIREYISENCYFKALTVKLDDKTYSIQHPIIIYSGGGLIGGKHYSVSSNDFSTINSNIKCSPNGSDWSIKRAFIISNILGSSSKRNQYEVFFNMLDLEHQMLFNVKRAAILFTGNLSATESTNGAVYCKRISIDLNGQPCHGIVSERLQDGSVFEDIRVRNVHHFYSGFRIEPTISKRFYLFDSDFKPLVKDNDLYTYWNGFKIQTKDSNTGNWISLQNIGVYDIYKDSANSEGITLTNIKLSRENNKVLDAKLIDFTYDKNNDEIVDVKYPIYGNFPTKSMLEEQIPGTEDDKYESSFYKVFTPDGPNTGSMTLMGCNETSLIRCECSNLGFNVYNPLTGVCLELYKCNNVSFINSCVGFSRIGILLRTDSRSISGITIRNILEEAISQFIVATKYDIEYSTAFISHCFIDGVSHTTGNQLGNISYYLGGGYYNTIHDLRYGVKKILGQLMSKQRVGEEVTYSPVSAYNLILGGGGKANNRSEYEMFQVSDKHNTPDPFTWAPYVDYRDKVITQLFAAKEKADDENKPRYQAAIDSLLDDEQSNVALIEDVPNKSLAISANQGVLSGDDFADVSTLVGTVMHNYVSKQDVYQYLDNKVDVNTLNQAINGLIRDIAVDYVEKDSFLNTINNLKRQHPEYRLKYENGTLYLTKDNSSVSRLNLPYVKAVVPKVINTMGPEPCSK